VAKNKFKQMKIEAIKTGILIAAMFAAISTSAQSQFSVEAGGGISTLNYKPTVGSNKLGIGGTFGVGYTYFFSEKWGIGTGVGVALFNGKYEFSTFSETYQSNDGEEDFDFRYTAKNYSEKQQAILLNIPLMLRFESGKFYAALGAKVGIPLSATFKNEMSELQASGDYPQHNLTLNEPAFMGFGTFSGIDNKDDLELKTAFFASAEVGVKWKLSEKLSLRTGVYLDYGFNNINKPTSLKKIVQYELSEPSNYKPNSIFASSANEKSFVDRVTPFAAGIKIDLVFGNFKSGKAKPAETAVEPELVIDTQAEAASKAAEEQRLTEQKEAEEQRLAEQKEAEVVQKAAEEQRQYTATIAKLEQPVDDYSVSSTELSQSMEAELDEKAEVLKRYPEKKVVIEGHTCDIGTHNANIHIGMQRAEKAKKYLEQKGIDASRITAVSKAETEPIVPNTSEENRRKNRRVKIIID
jgi:outer membrane protein OmpA-like peptidoglycan-associated protein